MKFLSALKDKAMIMIIVSLSALSVFLYYSNNNKTHTINTQKEVIISLQEDIEIERRNVAIYKRLSEAADSVAVETKEKTQSLQQSTKETLKSLDTRGNSNDEGKNGGTIRLDDSVVRVLSDLCATVKGSDCSPP